MSTRTVNDWLQVAAAVGVLAGLGLVAYELRQQQELARAQLGSETLTGVQNLDDAFRDPATASAYARALEAPESLTLEDQIILHGLFHATITAHVQRYNYLTLRGIFDIDLRRPTEFAADIIFSSEYGRIWWTENRERYASGVRNLMDTAATNIAEYNYLERTERVRQRAIVGIE